MDEQHTPEQMFTDDMFTTPQKRKRGQTITKPGRKVPLIDRQEVYDMAAVGCTVDEIAHCLKVDPITITRNFGDAHKEGHASMCFQLRKKQIELAIKGNVTMLIFLGKSYLGQFDTQRIESKVEQVTKFESADELKNKLEELIASKMKRFHKNVA